MTASVSQYKKKVSLLSQQTGKNGKSKVQHSRSTTRKNTKKTNIGRRPKLSSMNKSKKRQTGIKKYRGQGK